MSRAPRRAAVPGGLRLLVLLLLVSACTAPQRPGRERQSRIDPSQLVKGDIDRVVEAHQRELMAGLQRVAEKLYRRNPREWKKGGWERSEDAVRRLFGKRHNWRFPELEGSHGADAIQLALRSDYAGDRVFAFVAGLGGTALSAFNDRYETYLIDDLDAQRLYNAARNFEIAVWKLSNNRAADGSLLLLSNETATPANLSFEREFGRMIGNLDLLSDIIADKTDRAVTRVVQSMATAVFLPVAGL